MSRSERPLNSLGATMALRQDIISWVSSHLTKKWVSTFALEIEGIARWPGINDQRTGNSSDDMSLWSDQDFLDRGFPVLLNPLAAPPSSIATEAPPTPGGLLTEPSLCLRRYISCSCRLSLCDKGQQS